VKLFTHFSCLFILTQSFTVPYEHGLYVESQVKNSGIRFRIDKSVTAARKWEMTFYFESNGMRVIVSSSLPNILSHFSIHWHPIKAAMGRCTKSNL